ncbi:hypothetical protein FJT64_026855 [Amphibalanus amphitrite]|uniref:Uncharacterized protein n=1 Tax=Amphibalanus amphitrite TaxID=1232801 RepID=A0A6A4VXH8_AMPAM|nr:hypothetical protein FJT64_026855 [Amphibalanus amphitrite]
MSGWAWANAAQALANQGIGADPPVPQPASMMDAWPNAGTGAGYAGYPLMPAAGALQAGGQFGAAAGWGAYQQPGMMMGAGAGQAYLPSGQHLWNGQQQQQQQQQQMAAAAQWGQQVSRGATGGAGGEVGRPGGGGGRS